MKFLYRDDRQYCHSLKIVQEVIGQSSPTYSQLKRKYLHPTKMNQSSSWAPPISGRLFMGLADRADVGHCSAAQLAAIKHGCNKCQDAAQNCFERPI